MDIFDYYNGLEAEARKKFRLFVMMEADLSQATFYKKMNERKFTPSETYYITHLINQFEDVREG